MLLWSRIYNLHQIYIISIQTKTDLCCPSLFESHNLKRQKEAKESQKLTWREEEATMILTETLQLAAKSERTAGDKKKARTYKQYEAEGDNEEAAILPRREWEGEICYR